MGKLIAPAGDGIGRIGWTITTINTVSGSEIGIDEVYDLNDVVVVATEEAALAIAQVLAAMLGMPVYDGRSPAEPRGGDRAW